MIMMMMMKIDDESGIREEECFIRVTLYDKGPLMNHELRTLEKKGDKC